MSTRKTKNAYTMNNKSKLDKFKNSNKKPSNSFFLLPFYQIDNKQYFLIFSVSFENKFYCKVATLL